MNYVIIGAGGIGGAIGGYLAAEGKDVTLIARGEHLRALQKDGLTIHSVRKGDLRISDIKACAAQDDFEKGDVIFVCVKGYSLTEVIPVIARAAHENSVVIPILNTLSAGTKLGRALPGLNVLDGCIYTSSFISAPGVVTQPASLFRVVFGARENHPVDEKLLEQIAAELNTCGIDAVVSPCIARDIFKKFTFISAFATVDSYFDIPIGEMQKQGEPRELFISLLKELQAIADAKKLVMDCDLMQDTIKMLDGFSPDLTSSMHKDVVAGKSAEKQELIFDVVEIAESLGIQVPHYKKAALHFGYHA